MNFHDKAVRAGDGTPAPNSMKEHMGGLQVYELQQLKILLLKLSQHFDHGSECREITKQCLDVAHGLHDLWVRERNWK